MTSVFWASRAPAVIASAVEVPADRQRALDVGGQRLDLVGGIGGRGDQRALGFARAGGDGFGGGGAGHRERALDVGGERLDLACRIRGRGDQRGLRLAGAGERPRLAVALPAAESVRSTSAASDLIWPAARAEADDQRGLRIAGAGQDRVGGAGADGGEGALRLPPRSA